jgi:twitching motility protein PilT
VAKGAASNPADFELAFRMGRTRKTPAMSQAGQIGRAPAGSAVPRPAPPAAPAHGLGANPLGTGHTLPPLATSPTGHESVTSPNPLKNDTVFGSGFESLFGG